MYYSKVDAGNMKYLANLLINESVLESVESTSFLGICIDENLTWKKHINSVCNVLSKKIGLLYRIRHFVSRKILVMLYNAFILPHIKHTVWRFGVRHVKHS